MFRSKSAICSNLTKLTFFKRRRCFLPNQAKLLSLGRISFNILIVINCFLKVFNWTFWLQMHTHIWPNIEIGIGLVQLWLVDTHPHKKILELSCAHVDHFFSSPYLSSVSGFVVNLCVCVCVGAVESNFSNQYTHHGGQNNKDNKTCLFDQFSQKIWRLSRLLIIAN